jgi:hypothetical protein
MGLFDIFKKKKSSLKDDVVKAYEWIEVALNSSGYKADFSIESLKEIDRFFDEHTEEGQAKIGGLLISNTGSRLFALGSYVGEVIRRQYGGNWETNDNDPKGEINIAVRLSRGTLIWPVQRVMKRFKNGSEDGIYIYGISCNEDE